MNASLFTAIAVISYLFAGFALGLRLFSDKVSARLSRGLLLAVAAVAVIAHATVLLLTLITADGINLGFFSAISLVAWLISALLLGSALSKPVENLAIALFPLAALALLADLRFPGQRLLGDAAGWELGVHVVSSLLAYSLLTLATVQALLLAVQDNHLRRHHPGGFIRSLPPLQTMESLLFEMIGLGFVLLSIALVSGFVYLEDMFAQHVAHKTVLSILAWIAFAMLLWGRFRFGWRGPTALRWTLVGFVVLMIAYFGSKAILELVLNR